MIGFDLTGVLLFLIVMFLSFSSFGLRFVNKKITSNYWFWSIPAAFFFAYFIDIRYFNDWKDFFSNTGIITGSELQGTEIEVYRKSITISKALLLDLCPFLGIFFPLSLMLDKTRKTSFVMAPFCILGGLISLGSILGGVTPGGHIEFSFEYLFLGYPGNELYFFLHSYLIIMGFMLVFQSSVNKWKYLWTYYVFIFVYFMYVLTIVKTTGVIYNTSGVSINDWLPANSEITGQIFDGEYYGMVTILGGLEYPWVMVVSYFLGWLLVSLINISQILLRDVTFDKTKSFIQKNKLTFSKTSVRGTTKKSERKK